MVPSTATLAMIVYYCIHSLFAVHDNPKKPQVKNSLTSTHAFHPQMRQFHPARLAPTAPTPRSAPASSRPAAGAPRARSWHDPARKQTMVSDCLATPKRCVRGVFLGGPEHGGCPVGFPLNPPERSNPKTTPTLAVVEWRDEHMLSKRKAADPTT